MGVVVGANPDECELRGRRPRAICVACPVRFQRDDGVLPRQPVGRGLRPDIVVGVLHQPCVRGEKVAVALALRDAVSEAFPLLGEEASYALVEPIDLRPPAHRHAGNDDLGHAPWMPLGVGEDQG